MKLELIQWNKKKGSMKLLIKDSTDVFVNTIRRFCIDEVPTLAIEDVDFKDNSSALYDEIVAHRLGLIPISTDLKSYSLKDECSCKGAGCAKCQLKITLKSAKKGIVLASEATSQDPKCTFVQENMPIAKLGARQRIELEATAILGRGKEHSKWSPGHAFYSKEASVKTDDVNLSNSNRERIEKVCGSAVTMGNKIKVNKDELMSSSHYDACVTILADAGAEVTETGNHIFTLESWGQLDCKEILEQAADIIVQQLDALQEQFK